jgi:WD40 repeat-containing protein SMU1
VAQLRLPSHVAADLYEQVVLELLDTGERDAARAVVRSTAALASLRLDAPPRAQRLDALLAASAAGAFWDPGDAWHGGHQGRDARRQQLAAALAGELESAAPSRLVALLGQALKWQRHTGALLPAVTSFDLFCAASASDARLADEVVCRTPCKAVRFPGGVAITAACYSPDGSSLVVGTSDGLLEVRDSMTGALRKDLAYQAQDALMLHPGDVAITALAVSPDSELLASADACGGMRVWKLLTGACIRRWDAAHASAVATLAFSPDGTKVLSAGPDGAARLHGLRSGQLLRELRGHDGFVTCARFLPPLHPHHPAEGFILTAGADGAVRLHDARSGEVLGVCGVPPDFAAGSLAEGTSRPPPGIVHIHPLPPSVAQATPDEAAVVLVVTATGGLCTLGVPSGRVARTFSLSGALATAFTAGCVSRRGTYVYGTTPAGGWVAFETATGRLEHQQQADAGGGGVLHRGIQPLVACHPHRNAAATLAGDGALRLWRN